MECWSDETQYSNTPLLRSPVACRFACELEFSSRRLLPGDPLSGNSFLFTNRWRNRIKNRDLCKTE